MIPGIEKNELKNIFDSFNSLKVLIIGDVMIDSYLFGNVHRISPEAPVPIVSVSNKDNRLGGAANVALNIQSLGAIPYLCSVIGNDDKADLFIELLEKQGLPNDGILKSKERITTVKTRIIGNNHQMLRVDSELETNISEEESDALFNKIDCLIKQEGFKVIIFEDYDKGLITSNLIDKVINLATSKNIPVAVDPKKKNFLSYKKATLFKPNLKELKEGLKIDFNHKNNQELISAIELLKEKLEIKKALITLSESGVFISNETENLLVPAHIRNIADVSGAGDTVISVASLCLALGLSDFLTASLANLAGGLVCERLGVVPIDKNQLYTEASNLL